MIERVTYARLYALPGYENERFEAVAIVQNGDVDAAFDEAYRQVEAQYERVITSRRNAGEPQPPPSPPATPKQRNYIAALMDDLCWTSEQLAAYAKRAEHRPRNNDHTSGQHVHRRDEAAERRTQRCDPPAAVGRWAPTVLRRSP